MKYSGVLATAGVQIKVNEVLSKRYILTHQRKKANYKVWLKSTNSVLSIELKGRLTSWA